MSWTTRRRPHVAKPEPAALKQTSRATAARNASRHGARTKASTSNAGPTGCSSASDSAGLAIRRRSRWPSASRQPWTSISSTASCSSWKRRRCRAIGLVEELRALDEWIQQHHGVLRLCGLPAQYTRRFDRAAPDGPTARSTTTAKRRSGAAATTASPGRRPRMRQEPQDLRTARKRASREPLHFACASLLGILRYAPPPSC